MLHLLYPGPFCLRMFSCWRDLVPSLGVGFTQREVMLWAFTTDFFEQREDELIAFEEVMANNPQSTEAYLAQLHSIEQHDTRGRLAAVGCPVLTLIGEGDLIIYPKLSRRLHDELPQSTWVEVAGGHGCLWEYPDSFNAAVLSFLAGVTQASETLRLAPRRPIPRALRAPPGRSRGIRAAWDRDSRAQRGRDESKYTGASPRPPPMTTACGSSAFTRAARSTPSAAAARSTPGRHSGAASTSSADRPLDPSASARPPATASTGGAPTTMA